MASEINSFFFLKDNLKLTLEELRAHNFLVQETKTGFVVVSPNYLLMDLNYIKNTLEGKESVESEESNNSKFLMENLKDGSQPLMHFGYSSFGGCVNDEILKVFSNDKTEELCNFKSYCKEFNIHYPELDKNIFDSVCFPRHIEDMKTEEQKKEIKKISKEIDDIRYNNWKEKNKGIPLKEIVLKGLNYRESDFRFGSGNEDDRKFIKRLVSESL